MIFEIVQWAAMAVSMCGLAVAAMAIARLPRAARAERLRSKLLEAEQLREAAEDRADRLQRQLEACREQGKQMDEIIQGLEGRR